MANTPFVPHSIKVLHPNGSTGWTNRKQAKKYVQKQLADWTSDDRFSIQMRPEHPAYCAPPELSSQEFRGPLHPPVKQSPAIPSTRELTVDHSYDRAVLRFHGGPEELGRYEDLRRDPVVAARVEVMRQLEYLEAVSAIPSTRFSAYQVKA